MNRIIYIWGDRVNKIKLVTINNTQLVGRFGNDSWGIDFPTSISMEEIREIVASDEFEKFANEVRNHHELTNGIN